MLFTIESTDTPDNSEEISNGGQVDGETQIDTDNGDCIINLAILFCMFSSFYRF